MKDLYNTILSLLRIIYYLRKPSKLRKEKQERDFYVFGNGPSLQEALKHIDFFKDKDFCMVNESVHTKHYILLKPKFYALIDPCYFEYGRKLYSEDTMKLYSKTIDIILKTDWKMSLFVSSQAYKSKAFRNRIAKNPNITVIPINTTKIQGFRWFRHWCYKHNFGVPSSMNVVSICIFITINSGYKNIYLLGCEHSWIKDIRVNDKNQLCLIDEHFYNEQRNLVVLHTTAGYERLHQWLSSSVETFYAYHLYEQYSKLQDAKIWNATPKSFIDAFEKRYLDFC